MVCRKIRLAFLCLAAALPLHAQVQYLIPSANSAGLWGANDPQGNKVIPFKYSLVVELKPGVYLVASGGKAETLEGAKWGLISVTGETLLPVKYDEIGDFSLNGFSVVRQGNKYGIINGNYAFSVPCNYAAVGSYNEQGFVWVNAGGRCNENNGIVEGGHFGVYNADGQLVVPVKYKALGTFSNKRSKYAHPFASFSSISKQYKQIERDTGLFDIFEYDYVVPKLLSQMDMSFDSRIVVSLSGDHKQDGIIDASGKEILPAGIADMVFRPTENAVPLGRFEGGFLHANYYKIAEKSLMFSNWPKVDCITPFIRSRAIMAVHGANRFIDNQGQKLGRPYSLILPSETGIYIVVAEDKFGIMDNEGHELLPPSYHVIFPMREGKMLARKYENGTMCFLDANGTMVIATRFRNAHSFYNGMAMVQENTGWGLIDHQGNQLLSCKWFSIKPPSDASVEYVWVKTEKGGKNYCVNAKKDCIAFPASFARVRNFSQDFSKVAFVFDKDSKVGCINQEGNTIIPCILDDLEMAKATYSSMLKDGRRAWTEADSYRFQKRKAAANKVYDIYETVGETDWDY